MTRHPQRPADAGRERGVALGRETAKLASTQQHSGRSCLGCEAGPRHVRPAKIAYQSVAGASLAIKDGLRVRNAFNGETFLFYVRSKKSFIPEMAASVSEMAKM
jgi:hypothetical protein